MKSEFSVGKNLRPMQSVRVKTKFYVAVHAVRTNFSAAARNPEFPAR